MKKLTLFFAFIVLSNNAFAQISEGENAPDFMLSVLNSAETITLSELQDKVVYIFFYGAGCSHCRTNGPVTETEIFQSFMENENFRAFGIDTWNNSASQNVGFQNTTGISYPLLLNGRQTLVNYYGTSSAYDRSIVIGANNILEYKGTGFVSSDYQEVVQVIEAQLDAIATSSEDEFTTPSRVQLDQNYPNPFNPSTTLSFTLNEATNVRLSIYNTLGQPISVLADRGFSAGAHTLNWDASSMPSGIYLYRLEANNQSFTRRMLLLK